MREQDTEKLADFHRRAEEVRVIAQEIVDEAHRETILKFVEDCESMAALTFRRIAH